MTPEQKRRARLALLQEINHLEPIGEPFNDALFLVATVLAAKEPEAAGRALEKIHKRLGRQCLLAQGYMSAVITRAEELGKGKLPFPEAVVQIGTAEFDPLRTSFLEQLRHLSYDE